MIDGKVFKSMSATAGYAEHLICSGISILGMDYQHDRKIRSPENYSVRTFGVIDQHADLKIGDPQRPHLWPLPATYILEPYPSNLEPYPTGASGSSHDVTVHRYI